MNTHHTATSFGLAVWLAAPAFAHAEPAMPPQLPAVPRQSAELHIVAAPEIRIRSLDGDANPGAASVNPFIGKAATGAATGQTLTAPVTINADTPTDALTATQTGTGRALNGVINNPKSTLTALKGATNGSGAALGGLNSGTTGPAGQLQVTNASSTQPGLVVTTAGGGNAVQAVVSTTAKTNAAAVLGQHNASGYGIGVEGDGDYAGLKGVGAGYGYGVMASGNTGVYAAGTGGDGVTSFSTDGSGVAASSTNGIGVYGRSVNSDAGYFYGATGIYAQNTSDSGYAGFFAGRVYVSGPLTAQSYAATSDRNVKQDITAVDTTSVLDRIAAMPISSWDFMAQPGVHHIGPMAQDFRAAFGLGVDDKHIDMVDGVGVSLAAIQELQRRLQQKEARVGEQQSLIAEQQDRLARQQERLDALDARMAALERGASAVAAPAAAGIAQ